MITEQEINEAALIHVEGMETSFQKSDIDIAIIGFKNGAKWMQEQDQWIPVTERLPDMLQEVNVLFANGYVTSLFYGELSGFFSPHYPIMIKIDNPVTHWQPLPGAPSSVPQVSRSASE